VGERDYERSISGRKTSGRRATDEGVIKTEKSTAFVPGEKRPELFGSITKSRCQAQKKKKKEDHKTKLKEGIRGKKNAFVRANVRRCESGVGFLWNRRPPWTKEVNAIEGRGGLGEGE